MRPPRLTLTVAAVVVLLDAISKAVVAHVLVAGRVIDVAPGLRFELYYNHAGAGNLLTGRPVVVAVLSVLAVLALAVLGSRMRSRGTSVGVGLLLGGGIANLVDRLAGSPGPLRGGVIDWIRLFNSTGSMNLADLAINLGVVVFAVTALWRSRWLSRPAARVRPGWPGC